MGTLNPSTRDMSKKSKLLNWLSAYSASVLGACSCPYASSLRAGIDIERPSLVRIELAATSGTAAAQTLKKQLLRTSKVAAFAKGKARVIKRKVKMERVLKEGHD
ncbi:hypothetical protein FNV43_RR07313 [Rhamnella rubrinervis]|uniref:Uncharacterized protein n=1 Tax=Rhamnella rubrinervis TaxID=2594499 RepID=A0A8K0MMU8_9ROSA|nr:hypothetical protein FNV43_RR07313 [Rhamnella rubrinervis]